VTEEQPRDPVHLNAQALLRGFEDGGEQNLQLNKMFDLVS
jgi:hypothetical protein